MVVFSIIDLVNVIVHPWTPIGHIQVCSWLWSFCGLYDGVMFFLNSSGFLDFQFVHDNNDLMVILHIGILSDVRGFWLISIWI
jgi:hypothetical protein